MFKIFVLPLNQSIYVVGTFEHLKQMIKLMDKKCYAYFLLLFNWTFVEHKIVIIFLSYCLIICTCRTDSLSYADYSFE